MIITFSTIQGFIVDMSELAIFWLCYYVVAGSLIGFGMAKEFDDGIAVRLLMALVVTVFWLPIAIFMVFIAFWEGEI